jgi:hypothetical protein
MKLSRNNIAIICLQFIKNDQCGLYYMELVRQGLLCFKSSGRYIMRFHFNDYAYASFFNFENMFPLKHTFTFVLSLSYTCLGRMLVFPGSSMMD